MEGMTSPAPRSRPRPRPGRLPSFSGQAARRPYRHRRRAVARRGLRRLFRHRTDQPLPPAPAVLGGGRAARPAGLGLPAQPGPARRDRARGARVAVGQAVDGVPGPVRLAAGARGAARAGAAVGRRAGGVGGPGGVQRTAQHRRVVPVALRVHPDALRAGLGRGRLDPAPHRRQGPRHHGALGPPLTRDARPPGAGRPGPARAAPRRRRRRRCRHAHHRRAGLHPARTAGPARAQAPRRRADGTAGEQDGRGRRDHRRGTGGLAAGGDRPGSVPPDARSATDTAPGVRPAAPRLCGGLERGRPVERGADQGPARQGRLPHPAPGCASPRWRRPAPTG